MEVSWKAIAGFDNVDDHIDPWDNSGIGGNRIFPGYKNPDDTEIRHKLELIVKTSPLLEGKKVFVKAFDVDDSTSEAFDVDEVGNPGVVDTNGKAGDDNLVDYLNTPKGGQFWTGSAWGGQTAEGTVDSNGETKFIFRVGMQPGNNYRVVASVIDESMYAGVQTTDPAAPKNLGPETAQDGGAPASPLLTCWRRLWVENDSMEAIPTDQYGYKRNDLKSEVVIAGITDAFLEPGENNTWLVVPPVKDHSSFIDLSLPTKGKIIFQSESHPILSTANPGGITGTYHIKIEGNHTSVPLGSGFRIYDDDDYGLGSPPLPRSNLVNEQMKNYFKPSFIEVIDSGSYNSPNLIPFKPNEDISVLNPNTTVDDMKDLQDMNSCWVCPITAAYQGRMDEDQDGEEGSTLGETAPHGSYGSGGYYDHSTVFIETCRESYGELLKSSNQGVINNARSSLSKWIIAVVSHEIGHHPGDQDDDHPEGALMSSGMLGVSATTPETSKFAPSTIKRFRTCDRWSK